MLGIVRVGIGPSMALVAWLASGCASTGYASYDVVGPSQQDGLMQAQGEVAGSDHFGNYMLEPMAATNDAMYETLAVDAPSAAAAPRSGARSAPPSPSPGANVPATQARTVPETPTEAATDAERARELRIYTADLVMAVFDVRATQDTIVERIEALGGYLATRDDSILVVRVPAARFDAAVAAVEGAGQIVQRNLRAEDVTAQFRDLETRIRTLDAMRARLEAMLERAANVQEALAVERELERVTVQLESLRGSLRYLGDRVAYSTITMRFQVLAPTEIPDAGHPRLLPFRWLRDLGLAQLLAL